MAHSEPMGAKGWNMKFLENASIRTWQATQIYLRVASAAAAPQKVYRSGLAAPVGLSDDVYASSYSICCSSPSQ